MADDADRAGEEFVLTMANYLSHAPKFDEPSLAECIECGEDIPARRQAVGGVKRCVDCQSVLERKGG
ncbi:TraR/DksA C4-type zinc finger protein [Psychrobacter sp.]|uniref:TraR/DksA C4-type zinc finger protein n=1 Tax=Psychrobacter sp. TaxID=56811 RepID=UPI003C744F24